MWQLFFPHSGAGQSVLVRFSPNRWLVIDSNRLKGEAGDKKENPTLPFLKRAEDETENPFELLAVVLTHLHTDHWSGIPDLLDRCRRHHHAAKDRGYLVVPCEQQLMRDYVEAREWASRQPYLRPLLAALKGSSGAKVACRRLEDFRFAWQQEKAAGGPWVINLRSGSKTVLDFLFRALAEEIRQALRAKREDDPYPERFFVDKRNQLSYVLAVGAGLARGGFRFLFTSDTPRREFVEMTKMVWQELKQPGFGAANDLFELCQDMQPDDRRFGPLSGLTVPHHGSEPDRVKAADLAWWQHRGDGIPPGPAFAVVQGGKHALGISAAAELHAAGFRILASEEPGRLLGDESTIASRQPAPARPGKNAPSSYTLDRASPDRDLASVEPRHLQVCGGSGGIEEIVSHGFYEILPEERKVVHLPRNVVYCRQPETRSWH